MTALEVTKWISSVLVLCSPFVAISQAATVNPQNDPELVEAQAKFFQYRNLPTHEDFDQGHRLGSKKHFTERHEHSRPSEGLFSAKVRWGDKHGGYGEHYWDLNHAGHNDGNDRYNSESDDDGSYKVHDDDPYDEPSEQSPNYDSEYDPENASKEDYSRAKRDHKRHPESLHDVPRVKPKRKKFKPTTTTTESPIVVTDEPEKEFKAKEADFDADDDEETNKDEQEYQQEDKDSSRDGQQNQYNPQPKHEFKASVAPVPYENGAGVRQHYAPEVSYAESAPRLFLEPSTGHVVDRATGQAYVLQPIAVNNPYYPYN